jgi:hypothetical protein
LSPYARSNEFSRKMAKRKRSKEELERIRQEAENTPSVRLLRALAAKGWADLEARRLEKETAERGEA